jgi:hypothetical protein
MVTIAPTMPPQLLIDAPTWILFVIFGVIGTIALFGAFAYIMAKGGDGNSIVIINACSLAVAALSVLMLLWTPRVLREQGFVDIDVPLMTVGAMLTNMLIAIALPILMLAMSLRIPYFRKLLVRANSESRE